MSWDLNKDSMPYIIIVIASNHTSYTFLFLYFDCNQELQKNESPCLMLVGIFPHFAC